MKVPLIILIFSLLYLLCVRCLKIYMLISAHAWLRFAINEFFLEFRWILKISSQRDMMLDHVQVGIKEK